MQAICAISFSQLTNGLISGIQLFGEGRMRCRKRTFISRQLQTGHLYPDVALARSAKDLGKK